MKFIMLVLTYHIELMDHYTRRDNQGYNRKLRGKYIITVMSWWYTRTNKSIELQKNIYVLKC